MRRNTLRLLTYVAILLVVVVACELAVRLTHLAPALAAGGMMNDPYLPFKPRPSTTIEGRTPSGEFHYEYRHNSAGFRDVEHASRKPKDVFRILALGDSFTYGAGAAFEDTYLCRLERRLNTRPGTHPVVEIIKAGIPRYFPEPERILLERYGVDYSPDLILVGFSPNDVIDTQLGMDAVVVDDSGFLVNRGSPVLEGPARALYMRSHLCRIILRRYIDHRYAKNHEIHWSDLSKDDGYYETDWRTIEREYDAIATIAQEMGAGLVIVHIPGMGPWSEADRYPPRRLESWAREHGAGFIDVLPAMLHNGSETLYYPRDGHCTPEGYAVIAAAVFDHLTESNAVP